MPTDTFFRLEPEKQEKILAAAKKEFSSVSVQEASIANIIKEAEIPRGSFYQYFSGKEDVFYYLFDLVRSEPEQQFVAFLEKTDGDIFETFRQFFSYFAVEILEGKDKKFYQTIFLHMNYTRSSKIINSSVSDEEKKVRNEHMKHHRHDSKGIYAKVISSVDQDRLKTKDEKEFRMLFHQLWSMLFATVNAGYGMKMMGQEIDLKQLETNFNTRIGWIEHGVVK